VHQRDIYLMQLDLSGINTLFLMTVFICVSFFIVSAPYCGKQWGI